MDIVVTPINRELFQSEEAILEIITKLRRARVIEATNARRMAALPADHVSPRHRMMLEAQQNQISEGIKRIELILRQQRARHDELLAKSNQQRPA